MCKKQTAMSHSNAEFEMISLDKFENGNQRQTSFSLVDHELYIFEDNEAVIRMIIKSRSPNLR